jgi:hypothetical protein
LVSTPSGQAKVRSINVLKKTVSLWLEEAHQVMEMPAAELQLQYGVTVRPMELVQEIEAPLMQPQAQPEAPAEAAPESAAPGPTAESRADAAMPEGERRRRPRPKASAAAAGVAAVAAAAAAKAAHPPKDPRLPAPPARDRPAQAVFHTQRSAVRRGTPHNQFLGPRRGRHHQRVRFRRGNPARWRSH